MFYFSGVIISFFLALILLAKRRKRLGDQVLVVWLMLIGLHLLAYYVYITGHLTDYPVFLPLTKPLPLLHGPMLYLYTRAQTQERLRLWEAGHLIPGVLLGLLLSPIAFYSRESIEPFITGEAPEPYATFVQVADRLMEVSGIVYIALSLFFLLRYRSSLQERFSNTERIQFNWLLYLIIGLVVVWGIIFFVRDDSVLFGFVVLFISWIGYFGINQIPVFHNHQASALTLAEPVGGVAMPVAVSEIPEQPVELSSTDSKYQKSKLEPEESERIHSLLKQGMMDHAYYEDPELTLDALAAELGVHPNHLSQVINSLEHKNFYQYVNDLRVEAFIRLVQNDAHKQYTLIALAYQCGFNSKATFNRHFKKVMGLTPSAYVELRSLE